ncbi:MAG: DUF4197 domain-containing protein [Motiliproteus sp.]|nr:DUF4197 domain-containing protein [Motiliproteus sp.]MCW9051875.1 DUF4197 domain-containing protein [Motiliproteus sp.]
MKIVPHLKKAAPISALIIGFGLLSFQPLHAGWGDLLKKIEEKAPEIMNSEEGKSAAGLDTETLIKGLKEALAVGTQRAVEEVSKTDGYFSNPTIKVPMPDTVESGAKLLRKFGGDSLVDDFELSMNRAAEKAAPQATEYFLNALKAMSIEDAKKIYEGSDDAATRYFQDKTSGDLENTFKPIIKDAMKQVGVTRYYQQMVDEASKYPLVGDMDLNLENHVTDKALEGLFVMLAAEEKKIRQDPVARSTDLLKQVFGN